MMGSAQPQYQPGSITRRESNQDAKLDHDAQSFNVSVISQVNAADMASVKAMSEQI